MVKVGDKIRILFDGADHARVMRGDEFVVCEVFDDGCVRVDGEYNWAFYPCSYEVIHATPPQKITQNGYEYSLVGPVKPEWLVDGAWVVRKDNGCKHQVVLNKNGLLVLTIPGTDTTILPTHHIYDQYRPHEPKDWKWGDWAMYDGKRVFVVCPEHHLNNAMVSGEDFPNGLKYVPLPSLTPTF